MWGMGRLVPVWFGKGNGIERGGLRAGRPDLPSPPARGGQWHGARSLLLRPFHHVTCRDD